MSRTRNKTSKEGVRIRTQIRCLITQRKIQSDNLLLLPIHQCDEGIGLHLLSPLVLLPHLFLLAWCKIVLNTEGFSDLLGGLAFDHVGHGLARYIQQTLDIQIISSEDELEQSALVYLQEVSVPGGDIIRSLSLFSSSSGRGGSSLW